MTETRPAPKGWRAVVAAMSSWRTASVALQSFGSGLPLGLILIAIPDWMRSIGVDIKTVGLITLAQAPWSFKVLWSPLMDRWWPPFLGRRRGWIAVAQVALLVLMLGLAGVGSHPDTPWVVGAFALAIAFAAATQDIAIDAYTIGLTERGAEGPVNSVRVVAYRIGLIASGGALLFLPRWLGWPGTFAVAALASAAMALVPLACPRVEVPPEARREWLPALRRWLARPGVVPVALFVLLYRVGDRAMGPMVEPFWVDRGFSDEEIGLISNTFGVLATVAGAFAGGAAVASWGIRRALWALGALALASNLGYAAAAALPEAGRAAVYAASLVESFCSGLASVAFLSFLMRITQKEHAAVQYALLTAVYALSGSLVAAPSGWWVERIGYASYFAATAALALPAFAFLARASDWLEEPADGAR